MDAMSIDKGIRILNIHYIKMKKKFLWIGCLSAAMATTLALQAKDPVVMTVNGEDVPLSEFEYLYFKNRQQQSTLQPLDEYAEIFKIYKLKVADAKAMGIDTTAAFRNEFEQYRTELAQPFLTDSAYIKQFAREQYDRIGTEVEASHIMRMKTPNPAANRKSIELLDSLRGVILNGGDFAELAKTYSQDKGSAKRGGLIGVVSPTRFFPYAFEMTAYKLAPGEISEVVETPVGYHLMKGGERKPNPGRMSASHIMKMIPMNAPEEKQLQAKHEIDSLYNIVKADTTRFEEIAVRFSDDKASARKGGVLPVFSYGDMVPEFAHAAYALSDGEISEPIRTDYGWHIIKRFRKMPLETYEELEPKFISAITNPGDLRAKMINDRQRNALAAEFNLKPSKSGMLEEIDSYISTNGIDSLFYDKVFTTDNLGKGLYDANGATLVEVKDIEPLFSKLQVDDVEFAKDEFEARTNSVVLKKLLKLKEIALEKTEPEYRNLLHEFRDGSLLYEAGRQKVWDKAALDTAGLRKYFEAHRGEYTWKEPRAKGYLIQATNDSVENVAREILKKSRPEDYVGELRYALGDKVQIDRILAAKGINPLIDHCVFGGKEAKPSTARFHNYFVYDIKMITTPEEVNDVRGLVTSDYQNQLEQEWVEELKEKYPVTINKKVLKKVKVNK